MPRRRVPVLVALCLGLLAAGCTPPWSRADANRGPSPSARARTGLGEIRPGDPDTFLREVREARGKPLVVNFWASWCIPCIAEMPRLVDAAERYEGEIAFLGVNVQDSTSQAEAFVERMGVPFDSLADPTGQIRRAQKVVGLPTTQFYAADGSLAFVHASEIHEDQLEAKIRDVLRVGVPEAPGGR